jgi:hypothetical protein
MTFRLETQKPDGALTMVADTSRHEATQRAAKAGRNEARGLTMHWAVRAAALVASVICIPADGFAQRSEPGRNALAVQTGDDEMAHPYLGMWVTGDGQIRHELLPNGRYDEARGTRESAYQGRYELRGVRIEYWDDTGFTADGVFISENELHHGGMIFYRRR